jgi:hypothetical protein
MTSATSPTPPYAAASDVQAALGRPIDPSIDLTFLLLTASDLVAGYLNGQVPNPIPNMLLRVTAEVVANVLNRPQTPPDPTDNAYTLSGFAYQVGPSSVGPWLNASQQERLDLFRSGGLYQLEMFSEIIGTDVSTDIMDSFDPFAGTDLTNMGGGGTIPVQGSGTNEIQHISITGAPTSGAFIIEFSLAFTTPILYNPTASAIQGALASLSTIGFGNVIVTQNPVGAAEFDVEFVGALAGFSLSLMSVDNYTLPVGAGVGISRVQMGGQGS